MPYLTVSLCLASLVGSFAVAFGAVYAAARLALVLRAGGR
jgi:hypothetical protein